MLNKQIFFVSLFFLSSCAFLRTEPRLLFHRPLKKYKLTQKFSLWKRPPHLGVDLKAPLGTLVRSSHPGRVVYAGKRLTGYGNVVVVEHSSGWATLYAHLQSIKVKLKQQVQTGEVIGALGNTGRTSGPHLHLELMYKGQVINPLLYFDL